MSKPEIHYEVLGGNGNSWTIVDIAHDEKSAREEATRVFATGKFPAVKVLKEKYDPKHNTYTTIEIFFQGRKVKKSKFESTSNFPCWKPADLYSYEGRRTIGLSFKSVLESWQISPTELIHHAEYYYKLDNTGTMVQSAVQRAAVSQVSGTDTSVQERMKQIYSVIDQAVERLKKVEPLAPKFKGDISEVLAQLEGKTGGEFLLICTITQHFKSLDTIRQKLAAILEMVYNEQNEMLLKISDNMVSEYLGHASTLMELLGKKQGLGEALLTVAYLIRGELRDKFAKAGEPIDRELEIIDSFFASGLFPNTRAMLISRITKELEGGSKLADGYLIHEMKLLSDLIGLLRREGSEDANEAGLVETAKVRVNRYLNNEFMAEFLSKAANPIEEILRLMSLEKYVMGENNKRKVGSYLVPVVLATDNEVYFSGVDGKYLERMQELNKAQRAVIKSNIPDSHKENVVPKLDEYCFGIMNKAKIIKRIDANAKSGTDAGQKLLEMLSKGYFTEGNSAKIARKITRKYMKEPGFLEDCIDAPTEQERVRKLLGFRDLLFKAGMADV